MKFTNNNEFLVCPICGKFCWRDEEMNHTIGGKNCLPKWRIYWNGSIRMGVERFSENEAEQREKNKLLKYNPIVIYGQDYEDVAQKFMNEYKKYINTVYDEEDETSIQIEPYDGGEKRTFRIGCALEFVWYSKEKKYKDENSTGLNMGVLNDELAKFAKECLEKKTTSQSVKKGALHYLQEKGEVK